MVVEVSWEEEDSLKIEMLSTGQKLRAALKGLVLSEAARWSVLYSSASAAVERQGSTTAVGSAIQTPLGY